MNLNYSYLCLEVFSSNVTPKKSKPTRQSYLQEFCEVIQIGMYIKSNLLFKIMYYVILIFMMNYNYSHQNRNP